MKEYYSNSNNGTTAIFFPEDNKYGGNKVFTFSNFYHGLVTGDYKAMSFLLSPEFKKISVTAERDWSGYIPFSNGYQSAESEMENIRTLREIMDAFSLQIEIRESPTSFYCRFSEDRKIVYLITKSDAEKYRRITDLGGDPFNHQVRVFSFSDEERLKGIVTGTFEDWNFFYGFHEMVKFNESEKPEWDGRLPWNLDEVVWNELSAKEKIEWRQKTHIPLIEVLNAFQLDNSFLEDNNQADTSPQAE